MAGQLHETRAQAPLLPHHQFENPWQVAKGLLAGKSLTRSLFNLTLTRLPAMAGDVLDLGSKHDQASYYSYLSREGAGRTVYTDVVPSAGVVGLNIEQPFPFPDQTFDSVLAFHLFEHVFHGFRAFAEIYRVLRAGGRFYVSMPFLHEYHADPDDYFRFTDSALRRLCEECGFTTLQLEVVGEGVATLASTKLTQLTLPRRWRPLGSALGYLATTAVDRLAALRPQIHGRGMPARFALEYVGVFTKA